MSTTLSVCLLEPGVDMPGRMHGMQATIVPSSKQATKQRIPILSNRARIRAADLTNATTYWIINKNLLL